MTSQIFERTLIAVLIILINLIRRKILGCNQDEIKIIRYGQALRCKCQLNRSTKTQRHSLHMHNVEFLYAFLEFQKMI